MKLSDKAPSAQTPPAGRVPFLRRHWAFLLMLLAVLTAVIWTVFYFFPYHLAHSTMPPGGQLTLEAMASGSLRLSWPEAKGADYYVVELHAPPLSGGGEPELVYRQFARDGCSHMLPSLPEDQLLTLTVNTVVEYRSAGQQLLRLGRDPLTVTAAFSVPRAENVRYAPDPDTKILSLDYTLEPGDQCSLYICAPDGSRTLAGDGSSGHAELAAGPSGHLPVPEYGQDYTLQLQITRTIPGLQFIGDGGNAVTVCREDFLGRELNLQLTETRSNIVSLRWQQTKGAYYEVRQKDLSESGWKLLARIDREEPCIYTTAQLPSSRNFLYQVVAVGGQVMEGSENAAVSEALPYTSGFSTLYCTIWPVRELQTYSDSELTHAVGSVTAGSAFCVLDEQDNAFGIWVNGDFCYISNRYCLINLPDYLGALCSYDITNSYASRFAVHDYPIPNVTGLVTAGYEHVQLPDGSYLVPLLYPTAQKLDIAARDALSRGYRLKIYDAFRPGCATQNVFTLTESVMNMPLPGREGTTYQQMMTAGNWGLGSFLASGRSMHNLGIALDLTLETADTGEELRMQSAMHDLSHYSVTYHNNAPAKTLAEIMTGAGFGTLVSEWWHFQDNEARDRMGLPTIHNGVSPAGWITDGTTWRYRYADGSFR